MDEKYFEDSEHSENPQTNAGDGVYDNVKNKLEETEPTVELEIIRHKQLYEVLKHPKSGIMAAGMLLIVLVLIFIALAVASLILKKFYPYNEISTNIQGVTTISTEDKQIDYWLFNTAQMWANSGIEVQAGEELTIHSSGAWHTAVHHLVKETEDNKKLSDQWTGSEGIERHQDTKSGNDIFRADYRLRPNVTDDVLLMAVVDADKINNDSLYVELANGKHDIYVIGRERNSLRILKSGVLFFAVNDICLTRDNITKMYRDYIDRYEDKLGKSRKERAHAWVDSWDKNKTTDIKQYPDLKAFDDSMRTSKSFRDTIYKEKQIKFGKHPDDTCRGTPFFYNELLYYYDNNFLDAWFVDNVGSLLIIIERKH